MVLAVLSVITLCLLPVYAPTRACLTFRRKGEVEKQDITLPTRPCEAEQRRTIGRALSAGSRGPIDPVPLIDNEFWEGWFWDMGYLLVALALMLAGSILIYYFA